MDWRKSRTGWQWIFLEYLPIVACVIESSLKLHNYILNKRLLKLSALSKWLHMINSATNIHMINTNHHPSKTGKGCDRNLTPDPFPPPI